MDASVRQDNRECGPSTEAAGHRDGPSLALHGVFDDGESEARAPGRPCSRLLHTVEPLENACQILAGNAGAGVRYGESKSFGRGASRYANGTVLTVVVNSVVEKIGHGAGQACAVDADFLRLELDFDADSLFLNQVLPQPKLVVDQGTDIELFLLHRRFAFELRQNQQVLHYVLKEFRISLDRPQKLLRHPGVVRRIPQQSFCKTANGCEGSLEFV